MNKIANIIAKLNDVFNFYMRDSAFKLSERRMNLFVSESNNMSRAINNRRNDRTQISVCHWFNEFWYYFEISFQEESIFLTLSVFQGKSDDERKTQLFRAEWDNHDNNIIHPQPHWHIYPHKYDSRTHEDFETFIGFSSEPDFLTQLQTNQQTKVIDISSFHFAINGNWYNGNNHINKCNIAEIDELGNWISGILTHIRGQLEYVG